MNDPRFPIGEFSLNGDITPQMLDGFVDTIANAPAKMRAAVKGLTDAQLDTRYRDGGWTVRQVVHHLADSHMHSYTRFKFALTEDNPTIKPYPEDRWAELVDGKTAEVEVSLRIIEGVHARWALCLRALTPEQWKRTFTHPERGVVALDATAALYAWHCDHHLAHITALRARTGW